MLTATTRNPQLTPTGQVGAVNCTLPTGVHVVPPSMVRSPMWSCTATPPSSVASIQLRPTDVPMRRMDTSVGAPGRAQVAALPDALGPIPAAFRGVTRTKQVTFSPGQLTVAARKVV